MINIEALNRQHDTIKIEIDFIESEIKKGSESLNIQETAFHISKLAGHLRIHLMEEDKFLYPNLLHYDDREIQDLTKQYISEMGELAIDYTKFKDAYNVGSKISRNLDSFMVDAVKIIKALKTRILKEDKELYYLIKERSI